MGRHHWNVLNKLWSLSFPRLRSCLGASIEGSAALKRSAPSHFHDDVEVIVSARNVNDVESFLRPIQFTMLAIGIVEIIRLRHQQRTCNPSKCRLVGGCVASSFSSSS